MKKFEKCFPNESVGSFRNEYMEKIFDKALEILLSKHSSREILSEISKTTLGRFSARIFLRNHWRKLPN